MIFLDSNIVIDLLNDDGSEAAIWSEAIYADAASGKPMACNLVVVAEVAAGLEHPDSTVADIENLAIDILDFDAVTALRGAKAFREYRRRGGARSTILPDFLIAAHAATLGASLVTRDRRLESYFPELTLITPETNNV